jgi:hypothetical protein
MADADKQRQGQQEEHAYNQGHVALHIAQSGNQPAWSCHAWHGLRER